MTLVQIVNLITSSATVLGQVIVVSVIILLLANKKNWLLGIIKRKTVLFCFIVALFAVSGSLFYSEVAHYTPCKLCWFQRIFMYPQVVMLGVALWLKDKNIGVYNIALSLIGAVIAAYHYLLQIGVAPALSCSTTGYSVSCSEKFVMQFGYVTLPLMAFTAFSLILVFNIVQKRYNKE